MANDQVFWVGQKALIRKGEEVLILTSPSGKLDFPGGKVQEGEADLVDALKREVREEVGLEIELGDPFTVWHKVMPPGHKYEGKVIYLVAFKAEYVSGDIRLSDEHTSYKWVDRENYKEEVQERSEYFEVLNKYFQSI